MRKSGKKMRSVAQPMYLYSGGDLSVVVVRNIDPFVCWPSALIRMALSAHKASVIAQVRSWPYRQSSLSLSFKFDLAFWLDKIAFKFKIDWFLHLKMA